MKKQSLLLIVVFATGCTSTGWNINPLAQSTPAVKSGPRMDKKTMSRMSLARLSERHGQLDAARDQYKTILAKYPNSQAAHHRLGIVYARQNQYKKSEHHFSKALELGKNSPELLSDLGYLYYLQNRLENAEAAYRQALQINPDYKAAHNNLAITLGEQGRYKECLQEFRRAVPDAQAIANLAFLQSQNGDEDLATQNYHRALALDANIKPAAEALIQLTKSRPAGAPNVRTAALNRNTTNPQDRNLPPVANRTGNNPPANAAGRPMQLLPGLPTGTTMRTESNSSGNQLQGQPPRTSYQRATWSPQ